MSSIIHIVVEHVTEMPGGLPAFWVDEPQSAGERLIRLYLLDGLPLPLADYFRAMAIRDCLPDAKWNDFTVSDGESPSLRAVG